MEKKIRDFKVSAREVPKQGTGRDAQGKKKRGGRNGNEVFHDGFPLRVSEYNAWENSVGIVWGKKTAFGLGEAAVHRRSGALNATL